MKKDKDMLSEYDFRKGKRGKYAKRSTEGTNVVILDPDVAKIFSDKKSVNEALRAMGKIILHHERVHHHR